MTDYSINPAWMTGDSPTRFSIEAAQSAHDKEILKQIISSTSFALSGTLGPYSEPRWAVWGRGATTRFSGTGRRSDSRRRRNIGHAGHRLWRQLFPGRACPILRHGRWHTGHHRQYPRRVVCRNNTDRHLSLGAPRIDKQILRMGNAGLWRRRPAPIARRHREIRDRRQYGNGSTWYPYRFNRIDLS